MRGDCSVSLSSQGQERWSSRSLGSRVQHQIFYLLVRCHALFVDRMLLAVVVFYYTLLPHVRRRCQAYIQRRFGSAQGWRGFWHCYKLYLTFGRMLLPRTIFSATGQLPPVLPCPTFEVLPQAVLRGKGCIFLLAHVGNLLASLFPRRSFAILTQCY